jgi:hypothetical protein
MFIPVSSKQIKLMYYILREKVGAISISVVSKRWLKYFLRPSDITRPNLGLFYHTIFKGSDLVSWSLQ